MAGGGAYLLGDSEGTLNNCIVSHNTTENYGGGTVAGTVNNCVFVENSARLGGGAYMCTFNNCTLSQNDASFRGGGSYAGALRNSIVYFNTPHDYYDSSFHHSCTTPLPTTGTRNISQDPMLRDPAHLDKSSPCVAGGDPLYATGLDIDGHAWEPDPAIGCDQPFKPDAFFIVIF